MVTVDILSLVKNGGVLTRRRSLYYRRSNTAAMPWPPPMHIITSA
jgi:hypothetical protein